MIKTIINIIWTSGLKKAWNWILNQTIIDEKAVEIAEEVKTRTKAVVVEINDVKKAVKEVGNQIADIPDAAKGKKRKGRPKKKSQNGK